jgi:DNA-binding NtrC family response regulator
MENVVRRAVLYCHRGVLTVGDLPSSIRAAVSAGHVLPDAAMHEPPHAAHEERTLDSPIAPVAAPRVRVGSMPTQPHPMRPMVPMHAMPHGANHPSPFHGAAIGAPHAFEPAMAGGTATATARLPQTSLEARVDVLERRIIEDCLARNNHRRKETAAELGISRVTLYNKMKKFGLM